MILYPKNFVFQIPVIFHLFTWELCSSQIKHSLISVRLDCHAPLSNVLKLSFPKFINLFLVDGPILYPLKTQENLWFSGAFRGYKKGKWVRNGLIFWSFEKHQFQTKSLRKYPLKNYRILIALKQTLKKILVTGDTRSVYRNIRSFARTSHTMFQ